MKKNLLFLVFSVMTIIAVHAQSTLSAGDIAIFGVNTDNPDDFGFVLLVDIEAGTEIQFTDNGWQSNNTFRTGEGFVKYTAPSAQTAGTSITFINNSSDFTSKLRAFALAAEGDQVLAFQGTEASPVFIYAVQTNSTEWQVTASSSNDSALPNGLVDGETAVAVGSGSGPLDEYDNAAYDKSLMSGTKSELLQAISNNANWGGDNTNPYDLTTYSFTFSIGVAGLWRISAPSSNWSSLLVWDDGVIPTSSTNVFIPQGATNYPTLTTAGVCNNIILESNANGNASILGNNFLTVNGSATVQRYFVGYNAGADNGWHNISCPVNNMTISGSDFDPTGTDDDLYWWDESADLWKNYKANTFDFTNGMGYLCAFETSGTRDFVGTLNTGDFTMSGLTDDVNGFNLLGNPYTSALVWNNGDWTLTNVGANAQIWDEVNAGYIVIDPDGIIPSTNGFFVEVSSGPGGVTIPASARIHDATNNYKKIVANNNQETLDLKVTNDANTYYDLCRVGFKADATEDWDIQYDAHKLFGGTGTSQIWSVSNDENFVYNYLPYVYESFDLPINFKAGVNAMHHITADGIDSFFANSEIYLEDLQTEEIIDLNEQQIYSFTASTEDAEERFILHFYGVTKVDNSVTEQKESQIYANGQKVYVKFIELPKDFSQVEIFNMLGQQVYHQQLSPQNLSVIQLNEKPGMYIIRLRSKNGMVTKKVMIK